MSKRYLENILTKEYLEQCINRGLTQKQVAEEVGRLWNKKLSHQAVFYWMRKRGLAWGRKKYDPVELDAEAIVEATELAEKVISQISEFKYEEKILEKTNDDTLFISISDIHAGAKYDRTGEIDWKVILKERFEFFRKELTEKMIKHNLIPSKIVFLLLGDLVDGFEIYPNQGEMSDPLVNDQLDILVSEVMNTILHFSAFTEEVKIYAVQGNHGRISKRSEINNWDSVVYITLEKIIDYMSRVDEELNISIKRANKFLLPFEEGKWKYLIGHGHRILSKGMLGSVKNINNMLNVRKNFGYDHNVFVMGHTHQTRYWCNGDNCYYISNGTMFDSEHFSETIGLPSDIKFVVFTSSDKNPVESVWFIPLVPESYQEERRAYLF